MSCGDPHATDCREVIEQVYIYLDGEIDSSNQHLIREHLDECSPCLREFGVEKEVKALVARCCGNDTAPDGLKSALMTRLREVRIEMDSRELTAE